MTNTLVTTVNVPVFGDDAGDYPLSSISERTFGRWATTVGQLLTAHPKLAKEKLLPRDSVTPPARCALWNTIPALADIPQDYEDMAMAGATGVASVNARVQWNAEWLKKIARACAPDKTLQVLHAIRDLRFGESSGGERYTSRDVLRYTANLYKLQDTLGPAMQDIPAKRQLDAIKRVLPFEIRRILEDSTPCNAGTDDPPVVDTWEKGLARVAAEMKTVEDSRVVVRALARDGQRMPRGQSSGGRRGSSRDDDRRLATGTKQRGGRKGRGGWKPPQRTLSFKAAKPGRYAPNASPPSEGGGERRESSSSRGREGGRDLSTVQCFRCKRYGHYADACPEATGGKGGGRGGGKRGSTSGRGRGAGKRH